VDVATQYDPPPQSKFWVVTMMDEVSDCDDRSMEMTGLRQGEVNDTTRDERLKLSLDFWSMISLGWMQSF
jgi:hypothetical protein